MNETDEAARAVYENARINLQASTMVYHSNCIRMCATFTCIYITWHGLYEQENAPTLCFTLPMPLSGTIVAATDIHCCLLDLIQVLCHLIYNVLCRVER